jgi:hypothetical protein
MRFGVSACILLRILVTLHREHVVFVNRKLTWPALGASTLAPVTLALAILAPNAEAQRFTEVEPDPDMPVKEGFDTHRAMFFAEGNFTPLRDPEFTSMREAMDDGVVEEETPVLVFEAGGRTLVFVTEQMAYHHVAQGRMMGEPWMVTF